MFPANYVQYLVHFHADRDYFECHEVLEELWKEEGQKHAYWVGLIQLSVGFYHWRRKNNPGALKCLSNSRQILQENQWELFNLGIDYQKLLPLLSDIIKDVESKAEYYDINIPINVPILMRQCRDKCELLGLNWGEKSDFTNDYLINKHKLRDRSEIIQERNEQLAKNKEKKDG